MLKKTVIATGMAAAFGMPLCASATDLAHIRDEIRQMKENYETRIQALEKRLQEAEAKPASTAQTQAAAASPAAPVGGASGSRFNPEVSLILGGTYSNLSQDPQQYRQQGFVPGGEEAGPGSRGFSLGESELTLRASIDPLLAGQLTFALGADNSVSVEEAYFRTQGLSNGLTLKGGRFLSSIGYLNNRHAHTWDFADAPLAYKTFFGGQYKPDGLQLKWLAPTERFLELGLETGQGATFPGTDRNKNGLNATALYAHVGDDIGDSASWRAGVSYLRTKASNRTAEDVATGVTNSFTGNSDTLIVDGVYKWSPGGNATRTNLTLQGEYFRRKEKGDLTYDTTSQSIGPAPAGYRTAQSGWYLQGVYQFMPKWRTGLRYDKLNSGTPEFRLISDGTLARPTIGQLASYNPHRTSLMFDYSPSEFSRFRLQLAREKSRPDAAADNQILLQYIMSLGAHGAHSF
ncbi:MAG: hypothetical protein V4632_24125 [Pseudomonadota bacterium]